MNIEKEISTNKAKLVFYDNGTVEKQFFDANRGGHRNEQHGFVK